MKKANRIGFRIFKTVWFTAVAVFLGWLIYSFQAHGVDHRLLQSSGQLQVSRTEHYYAFEPVAQSHEVLIFFPGALVDPQAYIPLCRKLAGRRITVYLVKMPWRLASRGYDSPGTLKLFADRSKTYMLAGHSQGGKMAAQFAYEHPDLVNKLILIATTHPRDISLAGSIIPTMKIYGSRDGVANEESIVQNKKNLPSFTKYVVIEGGNHAQFGYYGFQLGDHRATISREQQQAETVDAIADFIRQEK